MKRAVRTRSMWSIYTLCLSLILGLGLMSGCSKQTPSDSPSGEEATGDGEGGSSASGEEKEPLTKAEKTFQGVVSAYQSGEADLKSVEKDLEKLVKKELSSNPEAWFNLGVVRYEREDIEGALEAWSKAGEVDSAFARGMASIGAHQLTQGNEEAAEATFNRCLERKSTEPGCNINLANMYHVHAMADGRMTKEEAQKIIDRLRFALVGDAKNADAYDRLARVYFDLGQLELAQLVCENAILQGVDAAILHNRLGLIALEQDDVIRAYQEFENAVQMDNSLVDAWMNIGAMSLNFRDYEEAKRAFERVLELRPDWNEAKLSYGVALRGMGLIDEAKAQYEAVLAEQPNNLSAIFNLGVLYQEGAQDYEQAISYYEKFLEKNPSPNSALAKDVKNRITNLEDLIQTLKEFGEM